MREPTKETIMEEMCRTHRLNYQTDCSSCDSAFEAWNKRVVRESAAAFRERTGRE